MNKEEELLSCLRQLDCEDRAELLDGVRSAYMMVISREPAAKSASQEIKTLQDAYKREIRMGG